MQTSRSRLHLLVCAAVLALSSSSPAVAHLSDAGAPELSVSALAVGDCTPGGDWGTLRSDLASQVLTLINAHRAALGLTSLHTTGSLDRAAGWKALHMARYQYMEHDDPAPPVARTVADRLAACGYGNGGWGENIAEGYPDAAAVVAAWLASPGHRANIENASYRTTGVGTALGSNGMVYWSQEFGTLDDLAGPPAPPPPPPPSPPAPAPAPAPTPPPAATQPAAPAPAAGPLKLTVSGRLQARRHPKAGNRYTAGVAIVRAGTAARVTAGRVSCVARVGRRHLRVVVNGFRGGLAVCAWHVPVWARGRWLHGSIRVHRHQSRARRGFDRRVR